MISLIRFVALSLLPGQVFWTLMDMARLSVPLKKRLRKSLLASANLARVQENRILAAAAFEPYKRLFASNHYDGSEPWVFNGQSLDVDDAFLIAPIDKADYTFRMVFFHFEWMFVAGTPDMDLFQQLHIKLEASHMFWHPSCLSQRSFVLAWCLAYANANDAQALSPLVPRYLAQLIVTTEDSVGANHRIDNFLAITLLAHISGCDDLRDWALTWMQKTCAPWIIQGYYSEKTPCYQALLLGRVQLLHQAIQDSQPRHASLPFLQRMVDVISLFPKVHLNDSYLPLAQWHDHSRGLPAYAWGGATPAGTTFVVINDARSDRGYRGHLHDASGALFVHSRDGRQIIGGQGTATYRTSDQRDFSRSNKAYCVPQPQVGGTPRLIPWKSFRHTQCRMLDTATVLSPKGIKISLSDRVGDGFSWDWYFEQTDQGCRIQVTTNRPATIGFWSDLAQDDLHTQVHILGSSKPLAHRLDRRWDGIGQDLGCHYYEFTFDTHLILEILQ